MLQKGENNKLLNIYTKEKIYELLPVIYRQRDNQVGSPLKDLLDIIAEQVRVLEDDIENLYNNWFIETCNEWVIAYIADLLGVKGLHAVSENTFSHRAFIANTIRYRQHKGTISTLQSLSKDITSWSAVAVEFFQFLITNQNLNHLRPSNSCTVDLKNSRLVELLGTTPFDSSTHLIDVHLIKDIRREGEYYNIPNIGIFLWRLKAFPVRDSPAFNHGDGKFSFSQIGYDLPLFNHARDVQQSQESIQSLSEVNVDGPIRRMALLDNLGDYYSIRADKTIQDRSIEIEIDEVPIDVNHIVVSDLRNWKNRPEKDLVAIDPALGRILLPSDTRASKVYVNYYYGFSGKIGGGFYARNMYYNSVDANLKYSGSNNNNKKFYLHYYYISKSISSVAQCSSSSSGSSRRKRGVTEISARGSDSSNNSSSHRRTRSNVGNMGSDAYSTKDVSKISFHSSIADAINAWNYDGQPDAILEITDAEVYEEDIGFILENPKKTSLVLRAVQGKRAVLRGLIKIKGTNGGEVIFDGLMIDFSFSKVDDAPSMIYIQDGMLDSLTIKQCTLVPRDKKSLEVEKGNEGLVINFDHTISGRINTSKQEISLNIKDSIIDEKAMKIIKDKAEYNKKGEDAINCYRASKIQNSTIFGKVSARVIGLASNSIFTDIVKVEHRQIGCMRFCFIPDGSQVPQRYHCQPNGVNYPDNKKLSTTYSHTANLTTYSRAISSKKATTIAPIFTSEEFGNPGYAQLHQDIALEIFEGADNKSEMGAFNYLNQPQRVKILRNAIDEYLRVGLEAGITLVT